MIKLRDILKEIHDSEMENARSWLSPDGKFYPTNDESGKMISHPSKALDIVPEEPDNADDTASDYLYKRGWQRIIGGKLGQYYVGYVLFCSNPLMPPNSTQKNKLIDLAKRFNYAAVIYDNEKLRGDAYRTVWDKND